MLATSNEAEWGSNIVQWCGSSNMRLEFLVFFCLSPLADPLYEKICYNYFIMESYPFIYYIVI